jgi:hypothetical protein
LIDQVPGGRGDSSGIAAFEASGSEKRTVMADVNSTPREPDAGEIDSTLSGVALRFGRTGVAPVCESDTPMLGPVGDVVELLLPLSAEQPPARTAITTSPAARAERPGNPRVSRRILMSLSNGSPPKMRVCEPKW